MYDIIISFLFVLLFVIFGVLWEEGELQLNFRRGSWVVVHVHGASRK